MAIRAARNGVVCIQRNWSYEAIAIDSQQTLQRFGSDFNECLAFTRGWDSLAARPGYVEFIPADELQPILNNMPRLADAEMDAILHDPDTMWYDESSLVFTYQDSFGRPTGPEGLRANRVGYDVGVNSTVPDIRALTEYFQHGKFRFPFTIAAGSDFKDNTYVLNFWAPPTVNGERLPVRWWRNGSHWHWVFPVGTVIGEVLTIRAPDDGQNYTFEVRTRTRRIDGWTTDVFRPFAKASEMAAAIREARPGWQSTDLLGLVAHLEESGNLVSASLNTEPYEQIVAPLQGAYDYLPATNDHALIKSFLTGRRFVSAMGMVWKADGARKTYAASTRADFHIVPKEFVGGLLETTEEACARCHNQTGRPIGQLDYRVTLYGEIWGEDEIFTWHPFAVTQDAYSVTDGNRRENPRLKQAGLLEQARRSGSYYREQPRPYDPDYDLRNYQ